jgi:hypothetical protein
MMHCGLTVLHSKLQLVCLTGLCLVKQHKAYWATKLLNFDLNKAGSHRKLKLDELEEMHNDAFDCAKLYIERMK